MRLKLILSLRRLLHEPKSWERLELGCCAMVPIAALVPLLLFVGLPSDGAPAVNSTIICGLAFAGASVKIVSFAGMATYLAVTVLPWVLGAMFCGSRAGLLRFWKSTTRYCRCCGYDLSGAPRYDIGFGILFVRCSECGRECDVTPDVRPSC